MLIAYDASRSTEEQGPLLVLLGVALGKALVVGKFVLIGDVVGKRAGPVRSRPLPHGIAWRSAVVLVVLVLLKLVEEWVVGVVHGASTGELMDELTARSWVALLAPVALMLLILLPLIAASEIARALGPDGLRRLLHGAAD